jgi:predicted RNA-binding Zn-ribbon protein involved in translation (DUF1610 family)
MAQTLITKMKCPKCGNLTLAQEEVLVGELWVPNNLSKCRTAGCDYKTP